MANTKMELYVTVGDEMCNITSLSSTQILCIPAGPPAVFASTRQTTGSSLSKPMPVVVHIGHLALFAGFLQYSSTTLPDNTVYFLTPDVMTGAAVGVALFLLISLLILLIFRRRSSRAEREYKRIQLQMDTLESHVRMECKQGQ